MSDTSAYVIRLELLKLSRDILDQQNEATKERLRSDWDNRVRTLTGSLTAAAFPFPELPSVTTEDVIAQAKLLNDFVSYNK